MQKCFDHRAASIGQRTKTINEPPPQRMLYQLYRIAAVVQPSGLAVDQEVECCRPRHLPAFLMSTTAFMFTSDWRPHTRRPQPPNSETDGCIRNSDGRFP